MILGLVKETKSLTNPNFSGRLPPPAPSVVLGMSSALKFSFQNKIIKNNELSLIQSHILKSKLPNDLNNFFHKKDIKKILTFMIKDKKNNSNKINLILLKNIGYTISNKQYNKNILKSFLKKELVN